MTGNALETLIGNLGEVTPERIEQAGIAARNKDPNSIRWLSALFARVAFITPEATNVVYDSFTRGWLGLDAAALTTPPQQRSAAALLSTNATLPQQFWTSFWGIIKDGGQQMSPTEITSRVAALAADLPPSFHERAEAAARLHPGVTGAAERAVPIPLKLATLSELPDGSLGNDFYRLIVDQKFDLEVLGREADGLRDLPPGLHYLSVRMIQMHDVWHLAAGYTTSALHENALASFQLAQFGHNYSAMYLATVVTLSGISYPDGLGILLQVIAEAWEHSRRCPAFMDIPWESEWHFPIEEIRRRHAIPPFTSIYAHDLIEQSAKVLNHPIFRSARWIDRLLGSSLNDRLKRGALKLHTVMVDKQKARASRN